MVISTAPGNLAANKELAPEAAAAAAPADGGRETGKRVKREYLKDASSLTNEKAAERRVKPKTVKSEAPTQGTAARKQAIHSDEDEDGQDDKAPTPKSRFHGVHWNRRKRKWRVRIKVNGRDTHVGYFNDEESAAHAYDRAVMTHNREWPRDTTVRLNFPGQAPPSPPPGLREGESAISMILAASQTSPGRAGECLGHEMETPPPNMQHRSNADACVGSPSRRREAAPSPHHTPMMSGRMLPPIESVEGAEAFSSVPHTPSPPTLRAGDYIKSFQGGSKHEERSPSALSVISSRSTPAQATPKPSAHKPVSGVSMKIPFPGEVSTSLAPIKLGAAQWAPLGAFHQHGAADVPRTSSSPTLSLCQGGGGSISSLCHEGELEALRGLMELGACEEEAEASNVRGSPRPASRGMRSTGKRQSKTTAAVGEGEGSLASRRGQSFRGVTWDKMKKMWRVRVCLAGGGREHVGYFLNEKEGALAYTKALARIKQTQVGNSQDEDMDDEEADGGARVAVGGA